MVLDFEKRSINRKEYSYIVNYKFLQKKAGHLDLIEKSARGVDICSQGLGIMTDQTFKKGDVLKIALPSNSKETLLPVYSQVVWVKKQEAGYRIGLQFLG